MYLSSTLVIACMVGAAGMVLGWWARGWWIRVFGLKRKDREYPPEPPKKSKPEGSTWEYWK